ncbi:helix-turn-helix transcriptional regulator [Lentzea sp. NPDC051208]|uniref:helix-turn-helix transcriptional regulator n=1 Tax=Lentzea sp. NPDC051208 TaxID=3154642 RepID=UPI00342B0444
MSADFRCLGVGPAEQGLYEVVLDHPGSTVDELREHIGVDANAIWALLESLAELGLVFVSPEIPPRYHPAPPDLAIGVLAVRKQQEIERARVTAAELARRTTTAFRPTADPQVQVLGAGAQQQFDAVHELARNEVLLLVGRQTPDDASSQDPTLREHLLANGVRCRTIYDHSALERTEHRKQLPHLAAAGENARVVDRVPTDLLVVDREVAILPAAGDDRSSVLVRTSPLLDALVTLFELLWERSAPLWPKGHVTSNAAAAHSPLDAQDLQVLTLLAAGLTTKQVSTKLGAAPRTTERRIRSLMDRLGARTRFQAGLQAAFRGWYPPDGDGGDER